MLLNNPTNGILNQSIVVVLQTMVMVPTGRSGRAIAQSCQRVSVSQVNIVLRQLESIGVVRSTHVPPAKLYSINHDHILTKPLLDLVSASSDWRIWLKQELSQLSGLSSAIQFGSVVRGEDTEGSDLDLLLLYQEDASGSNRSEQEFALADAFFLKTGNSLGIISKSVSELSTKVLQESALVQNILREGQVVWGEALTVLIERQSVETPGSSIRRSG